MFMSIVLWAQVAVFTHVISNDVDDWDMWFLGRAPRIRETLPIFVSRVGLPDIREFSTG